MLSWHKIEPPKFLFAGNNTHRIPRKGLQEYGPYDGGTKINLHIIAPQRHRRYTMDIINGVKERLEDLFSTDVELVDELYLGKEEMQRRQYQRVIINRVLEWRRENRRAKLLFQVIPWRDTKPGGYYWALRKVSLSRYDGVPALPVQTITVDRLREYHRYYGKKKAEGIVENLAIAFYAKVGLRPWILVGNISENYESAIYVGYDISYREDIGQRGMGGVVVFDSRGQVIDYFECEIQVEKGDRISDASFRAFLDIIIYSAEASKIRPQLIVFHRDGDYYYDEVQKISRYMEQWGYDYVILSFPKRRGGFPLLKRMGYKTKLVESGYYAELGWQLAKDGKWYKTYGLQSLGSDVPIGVPPNILRFRLIKQKTRKIRAREMLRDTARQVFWLTRLNYATKLGYAKLPITVHYSHKLANVKRNNIALAEFDKIKHNKPIWMI